MMTSDYRFVDGTSALKPDCSRYSNENERIIDFKRAAADWDAEVDFRRLAHARHASRTDRIRARIISLADRSRSIHDVRTGSLKGTPFNFSQPNMIKLYACLYTIIAIAVIIATPL